MAGQRTPDLEQRVRELERKMCALLKSRANGVGIDVLDIIPPSGLTAFFDQRLVGAKLLVIDREGINLKIIDSQVGDSPTTRQAKLIPETGYIFIDPLSPTNGDEVFSVVYRYS